MKFDYIIAAFVFIKNSPNDPEPLDYFRIFHNEQELENYLLERAGSLASYSYDYIKLIRDYYYGKDKVEL